MEISVPNCRPKKRANKLYLENWHSFFLIWPRRHRDGDMDTWLWLDSIERKGRFVPGDGENCGDFWVWEYRKGDRELHISGSMECVLEALMVVCSAILFGIFAIWIFL